MPLRTIISTSSSTRSGATIWFACSRSSAVAPENASHLSTCADTIYAKYGDAGFTTVTNAAAQLALAAPSSSVGTSFQNKLASASAARQAEFITNLKNFLASAFGGPAYTGPDMVTSHKGLNITVSQYNSFISEVVLPALTQNNIPQADIDCMAPVVTDPAFIATVVTCK